MAGATLSWGVMIGGGMTISYLRPEYGAKGPWVFATLFLLAIGAALYLRWRWGRWENLDVIGRTEPQPAEYDASITEAVIAQPVVPVDEPLPESEADTADESEATVNPLIGD